MNGRESLIHCIDDGQKGAWERGAVRGREGW